MLFCTRLAADDESSSKHTMLPARLHIVPRTCLLHTISQVMRHKAAARGALGALGGLAASTCAAAAITQQPALAQSSESVLSVLHLEDLTSTISEHPLVRAALPLMPQSLKEIIVGTAVHAVAQHLDKADLDATTREQLRLAASGLTTGVAPEVVQQLTDQLSDSLDLPLMSHSQKCAIVHLVATLMLGDANVLAHSVSAVGERKQRIGSQVEMLRDPERRKALATRLNEQIDLPLLDEAQEQVVFERIVDTLGGAIARLIPPTWDEVLRGLSADEIAYFKQHAARRLEEELLAPLPMLPKEYTSVAVRTFVDYAVDYAVDRTELGHAVLAPSEQLQRLRRLEAELRAEDAAVQRRALRQRHAIARKLQSLEQQKVQAKLEAKAACKAKEGSWWRLW